MNRYVVGFMFDTDLKSVVLVRKAKPTWQKGLLNGVGGSIENGESALQAMVREFQEETGILQAEWSNFCFMEGGNNDGGKFSIEFFFCVRELEAIAQLLGKTRDTDEPCSIYCMVDMSIIPSGMIENLTWLMSLARDSAQDGRPAFAVVTYPTLSR